MALKDTFAEAVFGINDHWSGYTRLPKFCHHYSKMVLQKWNCFPAQNYYFLGQASKITLFIFFLFQASEILTQWMDL